MNAFLSNCCHFCCLSYANCSLPVEQVWFFFFFFLYSMQRNATCSLMVCFWINSQRCACPASSALSNWSFRGPGGGVTMPLMFGCFFYIYIYMYLLSCYLCRWVVGEGRSHSLLLPPAATCCLTVWRLANMGSRSPPASFSSVWNQQLVASLTSDWSYLFFFFFFFRNILKCTVLLFKECYCPLVLLLFFCNCLFFFFQKIWNVCLFVCFLVCNVCFSAHRSDLI